MCLAMTINGFSGAIIAAQSNAFVASIKGASAAKIGFLHGAYGISYIGIFVIIHFDNFVQVPEHWFHLWCLRSLRN